MTSLLWSSLVVCLAATWPDTVPLPPDVTADESSFLDVTFDESTVLQGKVEKPLRGRRLTGWLQFADGQSHPHLATWAAWKPLLEAKGWALKGERLESESGTWSLRRGTSKAEEWLTVALHDYNQPHLDLLQPGGAPLVLTATKPRTALASVRDTDDWPFAPKIPGARMSGSGNSGVPFIVRDPKEPLFVADDAVVKAYEAPRSLSRLEFVLAVHAACAKAGWVIVAENAAEGWVVAHLVDDQFDVWLAANHAADGTDRALTFTVVDAGASALAAALERDCRATLRGVTFDFNAATLRPSAESVLARAAAALKAKPTLSVVVQGHTDSVGDDAFNQTLSERRAETVRAWLTAHGVPAAHLSAAGFGKRVPIADNDSDTGRAKNRRVELVCAGPKQ